MRVWAGPYRVNRGPLSEGFGGSLLTTNGLVDLQQASRLPSFELHISQLSTNFTTTCHAVLIYWNAV